MNNPNTTFKIGNSYEMRFIGDADLKPLFIVTKRTPKSVTFQKVNGKETFTKRVKLDSDSREVVRYATYSMAPYINSKNLSK
mgnify:CR=1 FL=1